MIRSLKDLVDLRPAARERLRRIIQIGGTPGGKGSLFFATITASEIEAGTAEHIYTWEEVGGSRTGTEAHDLYSGLLSLIGETVLMILGGDGMYRFCWDRPWRGKIISCAALDADIEDPNAHANLVTVDRTAGWYSVGKYVVVGPMGELEAYKWTIMDRLPMLQHAPLIGEFSGDDSNTAAPVQDNPVKIGCDTPP